ncbi:hypothetical protein NMY22_g12449 [Coprinellus aureogranulatus]|nr:hypothetical protein NMY22_g12449 [Coprinellus aureogranulatus]
MVHFGAPWSRGILLVFLQFVGVAYTQEIRDVWQTIWNRNSLFQYQKLAAPISFANQAPSVSANILVKDATVYQPVLGVGGTLTDSSAQLLRNLKASIDWHKNYMFSSKEGANSAALSYIRVPLGSTDFSPYVYSFDDSDGDLCLNDFTISIAPDYLFEVLRDILTVNPCEPFCDFIKQTEITHGGAPVLRIHLLPWSPPAWMKDSGTAFGGSLQTQYIPIYAHYLLKCLQDFQSMGFTAYAISIQNEPMSESTTYPSVKFTPETEGQIGKALKALMKSKGFSNTKLIGFEGNWDKVGGYPMKLMQVAGDAFDGVALHCTAGSVSQQDAFHSVYPDKEVYLTGEHDALVVDSTRLCTFCFIGSFEHHAQATLMWNLALDGSGNPTLPGANTNCGSKGCRGIVTINANGTWTVNQEFYAMAHVAKGTTPRDIGGPGARRIGVETQGALSSTLRVGAYVTYRVNPTEWLRYSLVVLNWNDSASTAWSPQNVTATIEFLGKRYAPNTTTIPTGMLHDTRDSERAIDSNHPSTTDGLQVESIRKLRSIPPLLDSLANPSDHGQLQGMVIPDDDCDTAPR